MELSKLISYDEWANRKVFDALKKAESTDLKAEAKGMFGHILAAQKVWMSRIKGETTDIEIWPELSSEELSTMLKENPGKLKALISRADEMISYKNSKGEVFRNKVGDILFHIIIHGQHHRAQIAKHLRAAGMTPPGTDYIFFLRTLDN